MGTESPRDNLGGNYNELRYKDISEVRESIEKAISKKEAAEILINLCENNLNISSSVGKDFISKLNLDNTTLDKAHNIINIDSRY